MFINNAWERFFKYVNLANKTINKELKKTSRLICRRHSARCLYKCIHQRPPLNCENDVVTTYSQHSHARPGWTTSRRGQDSPWKSQSEWQRTGTNGESTPMVWPTLGSRTAKEQNRTELIPNIWCPQWWRSYRAIGFIFGMENLELLSCNLVKVARR